MWVIWRHTRGKYISFNLIDTVIGVRWAKVEAFASELADSNLQSHKQQCVIRSETFKVNPLVYDDWIFKPPK